MVVACKAAATSISEIQFSTSTNADKPKAAIDNFTQCLGETAKLTFSAAANIHFGGSGILMGCNPPGGEYCRDADGDGYGDTLVCEYVGTKQESVEVSPDGVLIKYEDDAPVNYVKNNYDCNDNDPTVYTNAPEICDGIDNSCEGLVDEGLEDMELYLDADEDGFGDSGYPTTESCDAELVDRGFHWAQNGDDCDDSNSEVNPAAEEIECNEIDDDCDGTIDSEETCDEEDTGAPMDTGSPLDSGITG